MSNQSTKLQGVPIIAESQNVPTQGGQKSRALVIATVMASMSMVAIEATIVSAAMP